MIVTETKQIRDNDFLHTYSDEGMKIRQDETGALYDEAYDPLGSGRTYTETEIPIEDADEEITEIVDELRRRW